MVVGRILPLASAWLTIFFVYLLTIIISPLLYLIIGQLHLTFFEAGLVIVAPVTVLVFLSVLGGLLGDKYQIKWLIAFAIGIMGLGSFLRGFATSFATLLLFSIIIGIGIALIYPNLPKMVRFVFPSELSGTATGVYSTGVATGSSMGLAIANPWLLSILGSWREISIYLGIFTMIPLLVWLAFAPNIRNLESQFQNRKMSSGFVSVIKSKSTILSSVLLLLLNAVFYGLIGWLPTFLQIVPDFHQANLLSSTMTAAEIPGLFLLPFFSDRVGLRRPFLAMFFGALGLSSVGMITLPSEYLWFIVPLAGFSMGGLFSILLTLPTELVEKKYVGMTAGIMLSIGYVGALVGAPLTGFLKDMTGQLYFAFVAFFAFSALACVLVLVLPETGRRSLR